MSDIPEKIYKCSYCSVCGNTGIDEFGIEHKQYLTEYTLTPQWKPIDENMIAETDSLPKFDENVFLLFSDDAVMIGSLFDSGDGWLWAMASGYIDDIRTCETECDDDYQPIAWLPMSILPTPPKEQNQ